MSKTARQPPPPLTHSLWTKDEIIESFERYDNHDFIKVLRVLNEQVPLRTSKSFIADVIQGSEKFGGSITLKQLEATKKVAIAYAQELADLANEKILDAEWEATPEHLRQSVKPSDARKHVAKMRAPATLPAVHPLWMRHDAADGTISFTAEASELQADFPLAIPHPFKMGETLHIKQFAEEHVPGDPTDVTHWWIDDRLPTPQRPLVRITVYND